MQCTSCGTHSFNLREYSSVRRLSQHRKTIDTVHLCPACRVLNAINPKYVPFQYGALAEQTRQAA